MRAQRGSISTGSWRWLAPTTSRELSAERAATVPPRFGQPAVERETRTTRTLVLELGAESLRRLEQEAERQGLPLARLCEHAALLYLADLDAGRLAERIVKRAGP